MFSDIFIVRKLNDQHSHSVEYVCETIYRAASDNGLSILGNVDNINKETIVIAVGGDGTMIEAMKIALRYDAFCVGVNLGNVGFLTDIPAYEDSTDLYTKLYTLFNSYSNTKVPRRVLTYICGNSIGTAINEVAISQQSYDTVIKYELIIDGMSAGIHRANSVLVSTPTGSTAYSLSAGGSIIMPTMGVLQIVPVAPITLSSRPIIVSMKSLIEIRVWNGVIAMKADGQECYSSVQPVPEHNPVNITVTGSDRAVKTVSYGDWNFFNNLSEKLHWVNK